MKTTNRIWLLFVTVLLTGLVYITPEPQMYFVCGAAYLFSIADIIVEELKSKK